MKRINIDRHQLWVHGGNVASKYLRGNYLGMVPSTCRKPICLWLLEVLSYSCTPAAPPRDHGGLEPPPLHLGQSPPAESSSTHCSGSAEKEESEFLAKCVVKGKVRTECVSVPRTCLIHQQTSNELPGASPLLSWL